MARIERTPQLLEYFKNHGLYEKGDPRRTFVNIAVALCQILKGIDIPHAQYLSNLQRDPFHDFTYQCMMKYPAGTLAFIAIYYVFEREVVKKTLSQEDKKRIWESLLLPATGLSEVTGTLSGLQLSTPPDEIPMLDLEVAMAILRKDDRFEPFCKKNSIAIDLNNLKMFQNMIACITDLIKKGSHPVPIAEVIPLMQDPYIFFPFVENLISGI